MAKTTDIVRMLNLLPYFEQHPGRSVMAAASDLGVQPAELMADLNRLFCCGPGIMPDQLVDLDHGFSSVKVLDAQGMDKPLRLTPTEAGALLLALESLESLPGLVDKTAVRSAATKLRKLADQVANTIVDSAALTKTTPVEHTLSQLHKALSTSKVTEFDYYVRSRDELTHRKVSPIRLFSHDGHVYLYAFDHNVGEYRNFLVEMITNLETADKETQLHHTPSFKTSDPFQFEKVSTKALVEFKPESAWLADTIFSEVESVAQDGTVTASLPLVSDDWLIQFALSNADRMRVLEPSNIAQAVQDRAAAALTAYDKS